MSIVTLEVAGKDNYYVEEAIKVLRTNIQFSGNDMKVIMLTSCGENEGKTTVALHVAKSFAELGKKTLFIDADMRKSMIAARNAKTTDPKGLSEVLTKQENISDCLLKVESSSLMILLAGTVPPNPVELLNGKSFDSLIAATRSNFDYVIIDTPPLGIVVDAAVVADKCDGCILVIGDKRNKIKREKEVISMIRKTDCKLLGAVRNYSRSATDKGYYKKYKK